MTEPTPDIAALAAVIARQSADLSIYAGFLADALAGVVAPDHIVVVRGRRGLFARGRSEGPVLSVAVTVGENTYTLTRPRPDVAPSATVAHTVAGIVLSSRPVGLQEWASKVAAGLNGLAESNADTAAALSRITRFVV